MAPLLLILELTMAKSFTRKSREHTDAIAPAAAKGAVIVVGGSGGMSERYREIVEERGLELRHYEKRVPNGTRRILGRVAAVIVIVGMVSHALRDQAKSLVADDAPVVYLRSASVSALRGAVAALDA
jgi:hypothetical protein